MIYVSPAVVLSASYPSESWQPIILWRNYVTFTGIAADEEDADFPASNLANPQTWSLWKSGSTAEQYVSFALDSEELMGGLGIVGHNFGSGQITVEIETLTADDGAVWTAAGSFVPGDDKAILAVFEAGFYIGVRLKLTPIDVEPEAAVVYVGPAMRVPGIPFGHVPLPQAREIDTLGQLSVRGDFLGEVIVSSRLASTVQFQDVDWTWYIDNIDPLLATRVPFFFSWAPDRVGAPCVFAAIAGTAKPAIPRADDLTDVSIPLLGLAS